MRKIEIVDRWVGRASNLATVWPLLVPAGFVGVVTGILARGVGWIDQFGPFGWWTAGLLGFVIFAAGLFLIGLCKEKWSLAAARKKWAREVDNINPLDSDFRRKRINLKELASPIDRRIKGKRFTECELMGPANIVFAGQSTFLGLKIVDCDVCVIKDDFRMLNVVVIEDCNVIDGELFGCTIFVTMAHFRDQLAPMGAQSISYFPEKDLHD